MSPNASESRGKGPETLILPLLRREAGRPKAPAPGSTRDGVRGGRGTGRAADGDSFFEEVSRRRESREAEAMEASSPKLLVRERKPESPRSRQDADEGEGDLLAAGGCSIDSEATDRSIGLFARDWLTTFLNLLSLKTEEACWLSGSPIAARSSCRFEGGGNV